MPATLFQPRVLIALVLLIAGCALSISAWQGPADAMLMPRIVLALWCTVALFVLIGEVVSQLSVETMTFSPLLLLMAAVLTSAIATAWLGFVISALPVVALTLWLFRIRRPLPLVLGTLVIAGGLWFLFHHVLLIRLPAMLTSGAI
ncbi:tripartite tricarboxylate transporter TctB family protein [Halomonas sp. AOP12-C2-37]|uniref:tripartite tricarboxylate transporter TctB family protein n=1 Tax=unclassified Halomonas TaxID=2609666 RepID=UPI00403470C7